MSFEDAGKAIETRMQNNWNTTPIKFENVPFVEPSTAYVALVIRDGEGSQIDCGTPALSRWPGVIMIQVFVPVDTGTRQAREYADQIAPIFSRAQFSNGNSGNISCRIASIEKAPDKNGWCQFNVTVPYQRSRKD